MVDEQSAFIGSQSVLQAPPSPPPNMVPLQPDNLLRKRLWIVVSLGAVVIVLLIVALLMPKKTLRVARTTPEPSPSPALQQTPIQQQLSQNDIDVERANPENTIYLPPDVDMEVSF